VPRTEKQKTEVILQNKYFKIIEPICINYSFM